MKYVVITPARDEQQYIEYTIHSLLSQTILPAQWIIVDDGSSDATGYLIDECSLCTPWITAVHAVNRNARVNGTGPMHAFRLGLNHVRVPDWDFLVKLDADLSLPADYFESCFEEFAKDDRLGIGGGTIVHDRGGRFTPELAPKFHVRGATKIYRRSCWEALDGLIAGPGWDTIDEVKANMCGWTTRTFPHLHVLHHRPTGHADGLWCNAVKDGRADYASGYHPVFMAVKCIKRIFRRPPFVNSVGLAYGFVTGYRKNLPRIDDPDLLRYIRRQQMRRLFLLPTLWK